MGRLFWYVNRQRERDSYSWLNYGILYKYYALNIYSKYINTHTDADLQAIVCATHKQSNLHSSRLYFQQSITKKKQINKQQQRQWNYKLAACAEHKGINLIKINE